MAYHQAVLRLTLLFMLRFGRYIILHGMKRAYTYSNTFNTKTKARKLVFELKYFTQCLSINLVFGVTFS